MALRPPRYAGIAGDDPHVCADCRRLAGGSQRDRLTELATRGCVQNSREAALGDSEWFHRYPDEDAHVS
jgi:hypothetical protein